MTEKIIIAGAGGQGVILLGKLIAEIAMRQDRFVALIPSYGPEVRGGSAYCMVSISDEEISSPYINEADTLIIMNNPSLNRFEEKIKRNGLLILNSSLVTDKIARNDLKVIRYPFTDIAVRLGNPRVANMVVLGCFIKYKRFSDPKIITPVLYKFAGKEKKDLVKINLKAFKEGLRLR
ncbi:MAG: 2-oxoacid:acceptor oxidoreductase family protein [Candidatus Omnitrophica bacterium]|nr:2-oxoacid:acceptor oxidoreductase family protein [Candidatus Omnitrophota bacterium]